MNYDCKDYYEARMEEIENIAWTIADQGAESYDEFVSYILVDTDAEEILGDKKEVYEHFKGIWNEHCQLHAEEDPYIEEDEPTDEDFNKMEDAFLNRG